MSIADIIDNLLASTEAAGVQAETREIAIRQLEEICKPPPRRISHKAYLVAICDPETNAIKTADVWSSPEWDQSRSLKDRVFIAFFVSGDSFSQAEETLRKTIEAPQHRYHYLLNLLPQQ